MSARKFDIYKAKKYGNVRVEHDGEIIRVWLYSTCVVEFDKESQHIKLNTGGWRTATTRTAINNALKQGGFHDYLNEEYINVFQKKGEWFVDFFGLVKPFQDGVSLDVSFDGIRQAQAEADARVRQTIQQAA